MGGWKRKSFGVFFFFFFGGGLCNVKLVYFVLLLNISNPFSKSVAHFHFSGSFLSVFLCRSGCRLLYTAVDRDAALLAAAEPRAERARAEGVEALGAEGVQVPWFGFVGDDFWFSTHPGLGR